MMISYPFKFERLKSIVTFLIQSKKLFYHNYLLYLWAKYHCLEEVTFNNIRWDKRQKQLNTRIFKRKILSAFDYCLHKQLKFHNLNDSWPANNENLERLSLKIIEWGGQSGIKRIYLKELSFLLTNWFFKKINLTIKA